MVLPGINFETLLSIKADARKWEPEALLENGNSGASNKQDANHARRKDSNIIYSFS